MVISSRIMQCKICSQGLASFLTWFLCECAKKFSKSKGEKVKNFVFRILAIFQIMIVHPLTCLNLSLLETFLMVYCILGNKILITRHTVTFITRLGHLHTTHHRISIQPEGKRGGGGLFFLRIEPN